MNMNKGLIALVLIALLILFVTGCKAPAEQPASETGGEQTEAPEQPSLTGEITEVDNLDSEISEEELGDIEGSLDEITW